MTPTLLQKLASNYPVESTMTKQLPNFLKTKKPYQKEKRN